MHLLSTTVLSLIFSLATTTFGWEVVAYDSDRCANNLGNRDHRLIIGSGADCYRFATTNGAKCSQYQDGGRQGPFSCDYIGRNYRSGGGNKCTFYTGENCNELAYGTLDGSCVSPNFNWELKSFRCVSNFHRVEIILPTLTKWQED
jgi:hypothetical protein